MRKILLTLSLSLLLFPLAGCWDRVEINDLAIVTATGIDYTDDKQIQLSLQVFIPRALSTSGGGGAGAGAGGEKLTLIRTGKGITMADALSQVQAKLPRRVFWGHCKVYVFGERLARKGISEQMDFLVRHPEPRERAYMYVSKGQAKAIVELLPPLERYSAEVIRELSDLRIGMSVTMIDVQEMLRLKGPVTALPLVGVLPPARGEKELSTIPYIVGTAVFDEDKMIGQVSTKTTRGIIWLRNELSIATVTLKVKNVKGVVTLNPIRAETKLYPKIVKGKWKMLVKIEAEANMIQNATNLNPMDTKLLTLIEKAFAEDLRARARLALREVQHRLKADIFGFATEFHRRYPREWAKVKEHWDEKFPKVEVTLDIKAYIRRPGLVNTPGGLPEDEVREH